MALAALAVQKGVPALQTAGGNLERPYLDICLGNAHAPAAAPAYMWLEWHPYLEIPDFVTLRCVRDLERRAVPCCPRLKRSCSWPEHAAVSL